MYRKLIYLMFFVLMLVFFAGQASAAPMGMDGYADRVKICDDGSGNAVWYADTTGSSGFGDGVAEVSGTFGLMTDVHLLGDVSGDGRVDRIIVRVLGPDTWWTWFADYSTPTGFGDGVADAQAAFGATYMIPHAVVDLDGDGIADRVVVDDNETYPHHLYYGDKSLAGGGFGDGMNEWASYWGDGYRETPLIGMVDLNGDGLADSVLDWNGGDQKGQFIADLTFPQVPPAGFGDGVWDTGWEGRFGDETMLLFVGDLNADGYGDRVVVMFDGADWQCDLSSSAGFGDGNSDISSTAGFGTAGDILLLSDVLIDCQPPQGDLSGDCKVDFFDFAIMANYWLKDTTEYLRVTAFSGWDIFTTSVHDYRIGPSIIINDNNSIDMWCASPGNGGTEWDWIRHKKSTDGGLNWGAETIVLKPTPGSADQCSVCDPGVIEFGGYYYLGYTAIDGNETINNSHVFVARSTSPTGTYEKWNGSGWGGNPQPFIVYTGPPSDWGAGEPSFVLKDGTLYIYYTWWGSVCETRVATASASDLNWPANITYQGTALTRFAGEDSTDVKYIDAKGKFIGIAAADRFNPSSYIHVWESTDGLTFIPVDEIRSELQACAHNAGISGTPQGHIDLNDKNFIAYPYGPNWAQWDAYLNPIAIK